MRPTRRTSRSAFDEALRIRRGHQVRRDGHGPFLCAADGTVPYSDHVSQRRAAIAAHPLLGLVPTSNQVARLVYRFDCSAGCLPHPPFFCAPLLRAAVRDACRMALSVARKLEVRPPEAAIVNAFRWAFGHDPSDPFPGTWNVSSGDLAACQFRMAEDALRRGNVLYRCDPCTGAREDPRSGTILDVHALAVAAQNLVLLCPSFWALPGFLKAGVLLHEIFHLRFAPFFKHDAKERRQNSAYCFEVFALTVAGHTPEQISIDRCRDAPIT
jgi:hypothetical protein